MHTAIHQKNAKPTKTITFVKNKQPAEQRRYEGGQHCTARPLGPRSPRARTLFTHVYPDSTREQCNTTKPAHHTASDRSRFRATTELTVDFAAAYGARAVAHLAGRMIALIKREEVREKRERERAPVVMAKERERVPWVGGRENREEGGICWVDESD